MTDIAIRVDHLSKLYHLGRAQQRHDTLRDALASVFSRQSSVGGRPSRPAADNSELTTDNSLLWALKDVSFEVKQGEVVGIIGRNGAGKSTLLKILSRITEPTGGRAEIHGRVASLLEVGTGFHPELTGRENIYLNGAILGMHRVEIDRKFDEIVAFSEIERFLDTPVKRYSSGMYVRLAFAVAAHLEPEILLVDEVLAVGDFEFQKKCLGKMEDIAGQGRTVLFISHNMSAIAALCDEGILLQSGCLTFHGRAKAAVQLYVDGSDGGTDGNSASRPTRDLRTLPRHYSSVLARLTKATILNAEGRPCTTFNFGDSLRLRLSFEVSQPLKVAAEVLLKTSLAQNIAFFASSHFQNLLVQAIPDCENTVELTIRSLSLARGRYRFDTGLSIPYAEWLDYVEDAHHFDIETSDPGGTGFSFEQSYGFGATYIEHTWASSQPS
jgi:lipopolysaccharide transport system ATP-binding protein